MSADSRGTGSRETPVDHIIADFLEAAEAGRHPDPQDYLNRFPQFADELRSFFSGYGQFRGVAGERPPHADSTGIGKSELRETQAPQPRTGKRRQTVVPKVLGRYRLLRLLGKGAMGAVFLAEDSQLGRRVALKVPTLDLNDDPALRERFYREARAAALLRHPNICAVFDVGEADGFQFIAMAYVAGVPLSKFVDKDKPLASRKAAVVIKKLALALAEAHEAGIVHRDLKPANVMIDQTGQPVVMDFGLARLDVPGEDVRVTRTGMIVGSPAYMSPEQVTGDRDAIGPSADIYSLGVVLYELLTGRLPFTGQGKLMALVAQIQRDPPPPPSVHRADIPRDLEAICLRMLEKSPVDRPASMNEVARALGDFLAGRTSGFNPTADTQPIVAQGSKPASETDLDILFAPVELSAASANDADEFEHPLFQGIDETQSYQAASESEATEADRHFMEAGLAFDAMNSSTPAIARLAGSELSSLQNSRARGTTSRLIAAGVVVCMLVSGLAYQIGRSTHRTEPRGPSAVLESSELADQRANSAALVSPLVSESPVTTGTAAVPKVTTAQMAVADDVPTKSIPLPVETPQLVPLLELRSAPHRSGFNGGVLLHLGIRNWTEFAQLKGLVARLLDENDRTLGQRTLEDASELDGRLVMALTHQQLLPPRVRLRLSAGDDPKTFDSNLIETGVVSGRQTVPISLVPHSTRGLLDDVASTLKQRTSGNNLSELKIGRRVLGGVQFQIEDAVVELKSAVASGLPRSCTGLRVGQSLVKIHLLVTCPRSVNGPSTNDPIEGSSLAHCVVHFADQSTANIPIQYGVHVGNWLGNSPIPSLKDGALAWIGANAESLRNPKDRKQTLLYLTSWTNPTPDVAIESLDLVSDESQATLVWVAIAGEVAGAGMAEEPVTIAPPSTQFEDPAMLAFWSDQRDIATWAVQAGGVVFCVGSNLPYQPNSTLPSKPVVQRLAFANRNLGDALDRLKGCSQLISLKLDHTETTAVGLRHLSGLPLLRDLLLNNNPVSDDGLVVLATLPQLESLELPGTRITPAGLKALCDCQKLRHLCLRKSVLTDEGLVHLRSMPSLKSLWCDADDETLKRICSSLSLTDLVLEDTRIAPITLTELKRMSTLRRLELLDVPLNANAISRLGDLGQLTELRVTGISASELLRLKKQLPQCVVTQVQMK